jgi:hypothetical protein
MVNSRGNNSDTIRDGHGVAFECSPCERERIQVARKTHLLVSATLAQLLPIKFPVAARHGRHRAGKHLHRHAHRAAHSRLNDHSCDDLPTMILRYRQYGVRYKECITCSGWFEVEHASSFPREEAAVTGNCRAVAPSPKAYGK